MEKHDLWKVFLLIGLCIIIALCNVFNIGLMGLDIKELELSAQGPFTTKEEEIEGKQAKKVLPLRRKGNLALCSILIVLIASSSYVSIMFAELLGDTIGLIVSVPTIVIAGELIP